MMFNILRDAARAPRIRVERGPTGAAAWHLPNSEAVVLWNGPGSGLFLVMTPRGRLIRIEHPTADGNYRSFREADEAARRFIRAERDPARPRGRRISREKQRRISDKIRVLRHEGYPQRQAIAIAHQMEGVSRRRRDRR